MNVKYLLLYYYFDMEKRIFVIMVIEILVVIYNLCVYYIWSFIY